MFQAIAKFLYRHPRKEENSLKLKLDLFILSYACLASFVGKLDHTNLSNAWASGMPEEIGLSESRYSEITSVYQAGYAIAQLPANLSLLWIRPRYVMPSFVFVMGIVSLSTSFVQDLAGIQALRFILGMTEAANYCCCSYLLGSWFNQQEMGKRAGIYTAIMHLGSVVSGPIQSGINGSLHNVLGRSGWRWLFIIDAIITFPVAVWGVLVIPDTPSKSKAFYLTPEELNLARTRMKPRDVLNFTKKSFLKVVTSWQWPCFMLLGVMLGMVEIFTFNAMAPLFFRGFPDIYSVSDANNLPSIGYVIAGISNIGGAAITDYLGNRFFGSFFLFVGGVVSGSIFVAWPSSQAALQFAIYFHGLVFAGQAVFFTWANEATAYDPFLRTFTVGSMNLAAYIWLIWYGIVVFSSKYAPQFKDGWCGTIGKGHLEIVDDHPKWKLMDWVLAVAIAVVPYCYWLYWMTKRTPGTAWGKVKKDEDADREEQAQEDVSAPTSTAPQLDKVFDPTESSHSASADTEKKGDEAQVAVAVAPATASAQLQPHTM